MKQYVAQVYLMTASGDEIQFLCTPGTHHDKIKRIKEGRIIIEERVRFIEKLPQKTGWSFADIPKLESVTERIKQTWRPS